MYSNFKEQAIEYVKQAVEEDKAGNYPKAFPLYMNALEYFKTHLKYEKDPKIKEAITLKIFDYLRRAEEIRALLDSGGPAVGVAAGPKTKAKEEEGGDGEEPEQARVQADFAEMKISTSRESAIEYVKKAVEEDNAGNYAKAFPMYMNTLEYFKTYLKYEKNPKIKEAISSKFSDYLRRAKEIRTLLDAGGPAVGVAAGPKTKAKEEEGGDGEEPEQARVQADFAEMNIRTFRESAIEFLKKAVEEDNAGNYAKAFPLYMNALEYFKTSLKYEKNPKITEAIACKFNEYLLRAEEIKAFLDEYGPGPSDERRENS